MRGYLSGLLVGSVVSVLGLGVVSQLAPLPQRGESAGADPAVMPETAEVAEPAMDPQTPTEAEPAPASEQAVVAEPAAAPEPEPPAPPPTAAVSEAPLEPAPPAQSEAAPEPVPQEPAPVAEPDPTELAVGLDRAADPSPAGAEPPPVPPLTPEEQAILAPLPGEVPPGSPLAPELEVVEPTLPDPAPTEPPAPAEPLLDRPEPGFGKPVEGVTVGNLPAIGVTPPAEPAAEPGLGEDAPPVKRHAEAFDNPAGKPRFAIILADDGRADLDRTGLAALPLPVTIALDPTAPGVTALAETYRKAGKEVAMLATAIPAGAKASDLQVTFGSHASAVPQAVAVIDLPVDGFQNDRTLSTDLVPLIKDQGRGLVTFDRGLNAGEQLARREAVPSALIFRQIDAEGETAPVMRRYLDRAAFKAAQDGRVVVYGTARAETIAALLEWSIEGRAGSVALAPLTAVLEAAE
ncbi:divergent polysaccharide deacetylase family protein [Gemmobacter denitrificans]|uniref:Divergent polysaccharide deacetylase family protein n=1 Tax=Gemmobacter denitrificans TaxID=3123040 RepID=A0ABU8BTC7_9RHOB